MTFFLQRNALYYTVDARPAGSQPGGLAPHPGGGHAGERCGAEAFSPLPSTEGSAGPTLDPTAPLPLPLYPGSTQRYSVDETWRFEGWSVHAVISGADFATSATERGLNREFLNSPNSGPPGVFPARRFGKVEGWALADRGSQEVAHPDQSRRARRASERKRELREPLDKRRKPAVDATERGKRVTWGSLFLFFF